jgi:hypothetical protein
LNTRFNLHNASNIAAAAAIQSTINQSINQSINQQSRQTFGIFVVVRGTGAVIRAVLKLLNE